MTTIKRISIQMAGGQPELSSAPPRPPQKSPDRPRSTTTGPSRPSRLTVSTKSTKSASLGSRGMAGPPVTPFSDGNRVTRICYYKYTGPEASADGSSAGQTKLYLSTSPCAIEAHPKSAGRKESATVRSARGPVRRVAPKWASAAAAHNLLSMDYHLSELSLHYRAPGDSARPTYLPPPPLMADRKDLEVGRVLEEEDDDMVSPPPPPSSSVPSPRASPGPPSTASLSPSTPSFPEPEEYVQKSTSNRLLNVISIDECHVKHRRARQRVKSQHGRSHRSPDPQDAEAIPDDTGDCPSLAASSGLYLEPRNAVLDRIERLHGLRSAPGTAGGGGRAQQLFTKRNQLLREHMNVYVAWRTSERLKERFEKMRGIKSAHSVLEADKEERLKAFSAVLRSKEMEFAQQNGAPPYGSEEEDEDEEEGSDDLKDALLFPNTERDKLTRMWEMLQ